MAIGWETEGGELEARRTGRTVGWGWNSPQRSWSRWSWECGSWCVDGLPAVASRSRISQMRRPRRNRLSRPACMAMAWGVHARNSRDRGPDGVRASIERLTESHWRLRHCQVRPIVNERRYAVTLNFVETVNIGEMATGPVKAVIDCLWPLLGGRPSAPDDGCVVALTVCKQQELRGGVAVRVQNARMV